MVYVWNDNTLNISRYSSGNNGQKSDVYEGSANEFKTFWAIMGWYKCPKLAQPGHQFPKRPSESQSCCGVASQQTHQFKGNESGANLCPNWGLSSPLIKQSQLSPSLQQNVHKEKLCLTHLLVLRVNNEIAKAKLIDSINLNLPNKIWQFQKKGKWAIPGRGEGYGTRSYQRQFASVVILWE